MTIPELQQMKRDARKIVGVVVYDYQMAQIVDRAGVDIVSVGDSVGKNVWGQESELEVTLDQMLLACKAVRRGVKHAVLSCDLPYGPVQQGNAAAVRAAAVLAKEGGADMVKVDAAAEFPETVRAIVQAGIPVWAQFGVTPHTAGSAYGGTRPTYPSGFGGQVGGTRPAYEKGGTGPTERFVEEAWLLESVGSSMLDFTHSGPEAGPAVVNAVAIPVIGGLGGGPWLDGRVRAIGNAIGNLATALDDTTERYANVARITLDAMKMYSDDVRAGRTIKGEPGPKGPQPGPKGPGLQAEK